MTTRRQAVLACAASVTGFVAKIAAGPRELLRVSRVPGGGLQPQVATDDQGTLHLLYYAGDPQQGDLFYLKSTDGGTTFSRAIRVNSQPGSAIAMGTIRGAQLAVGKDRRVHVSWNGSSDATPAGPLNPDSGKLGMPMLYARLNDAETAFQPQRNLMRHSFGLDGGGSIAADRFQNVYVAWHGYRSGGGLQHRERGRGQKTIVDREVARRRPLVLIGRKSMVPGNRGLRLLRNEDFRRPPRKHLCTLPFCHGVGSSGHLPPDISKPGSALPRAAASQVGHQRLSDEQHGYRLRSEIASHLLITWPPS